MISGEGTNLQALIDAEDVDVACVVSSRDGAPGLGRAERAGIAHLATADEVEAARFLEEHGVELVVLAGYMRILSPAFLARFPQRVVNLHPSLLPSFPGRAAVAQALERGVRVTGVTVHLVDESVDSGPILLQEPVRVAYDDTPSTLLDRLHEVERRLLTEAVRLFAAGRVRIEDGRTYVEGVEAE
jgi:phosphoribosylglycinamide formyltransferase 1